MKAIEQVDVVIYTVGSMQLADQTKIIAAIKETGNIKVIVSFRDRYPFEMEKVGKWQLKHMNKKFSLL